MKNLFKLILVFCITTINLYPQEWVKIIPIFEPPGNYNTINGVFVNEKKGWWTTGPNASVFHTTNMGFNWQEQVNNIALEHIEFIDTLHGWMAGRILPGNAYKIVITKDGGWNWDSYHIPPILCFTFFDSLNGFAGGEDTIYSTTDGGVTWKPQRLDAPYPTTILDIFFTDKKFGWAVGSRDDVFDGGGVMFNSIDSGKTWQFNAILEMTGTEVYFTDSLNGCIIGYSWGAVIQVTKDGGKSWIIHYPPSPLVNDVFFTSSSNGWVVGNYGFIWHTTDGGINWIQIESGTTSDLHNIFFFNDGKTGYILGADITLLKYDSTVGVMENSKPSELSFELFQNYPNPFNPNTQIEFSISKTDLITLTIYDLLGREVRTLVNEEKEQDSYMLNWDGKDKNGKPISSGIYLYRLQSGSLSLCKKMTLIR